MKTTGINALVVVDMQRGYIDPSCHDAFPNGYVIDGSVLKNVRALVDLAHKTRMQVFFSVIAFSHAQMETNLWVKQLPQLRLLEVGSVLVEVDSRLDFDPAHDHLFAKQYPSIFTSSDFVDALEAASIDRCIFCGITMSGCVMASVMESLPHGKVPVVVKDAVADRSPLLRDLAVDKVSKTYGEVWSTADTFSALSARS